MIDVMDGRREHRCHHLGEGGEHQLHQGNQFGPHLQGGEDGLQSMGVEQLVHREGDVSRVATVVVWHLRRNTLFLYFRIVLLAPQSGSALLG